MLYAVAECLGVFFGSWLWAFFMTAKTFKIMIANNTKEEHSLMAKDHVMHIESG